MLPNPTRRLSMRNCWQMVTTYWSITIPSLIVATYGGGTGLATQLECLEMLGCFDRWRIVAFRPHRSLHNVVEFRGKRVSPKDVQFSLLDNGTTAGRRPALRRGRRAMPCAGRSRQRLRQALQRSQ
jgi:hypothetical protein